MSFKINKRLTRLVGFPADQPEAGAVESRAHQAGFSIEGARLGSCIEGLEAVARFPVPETDGAVVACWGVRCVFSRANWIKDVGVFTSRKQDVIFVDAKGVDGGILTLEVLHKGPLRTFPLLDAPGASACESPFDRVNRQSSDTLFVVGERGHGLPGGKVPEPDM